LIETFFAEKYPEIEPLLKKLDILINKNDQMIDYNLISPLLTHILNNDNAKLEKFSSILLKQNKSDLAYFIAVCCFSKIFGGKMDNKFINFKDFFGDHASKVRFFNIFKEQIKRFKG